MARAHRIRRICRLALAGAVLVLLAGAAAAQSINLLDGNPKNGLSNTSFLRNAVTNNPEVLDVLRASPLTSATLAGPVISLQLNDVRGRAVMHEIAKCALAPSHTLTYVDAAAVTYQWRGELGLCEHPENDVGSWPSAAPTQACLELVTACVMARVNALRMAVPLALEGQPESMFPDRPAVATERTWREADGPEDPTDGTLLDGFSLGPCRPGHDCRWAPAYVGKCEGGVVSLRVDGAGCATTRIRVCAGIHGCYDTSPFPDYSRFIREQAGACTATPITFSCPTAIPFGGYYSVMTKPNTLEKPPIVSPPVVKVSGSGVLAADENRVFSYLEGAFYGDMFEPDDLEVTCEVSAAAPTVRSCTRADDGTAELPSCVPGQAPFPPFCISGPRPSPFRNVYACYALTSGATPDEEALAVSYLNDRICAQRDPAETCFPHPPRRCDARCAWDPSNGSWQSCRGALLGGQRVYRAITTYLNGPCDLIGNPPLCSKLRGLLQDGPYLPDRK